jgi:hypothetical protein
MISTSNHREKLRKMISADPNSPDGKSLRNYGWMHLESLLNDIDELAREYQYAEASKSDSGSD